MEPKTLTSAGMETMNETVSRAKEMVNTSSDNQASESLSAPDVSKIESPATPLTTPETGATPTPLEEFTTVTPEMVAEQQALRERRAAQTATGQDLYEGLLGLGTKGQATIQAEQEAGIGRLSTELTDVENEIAQKSLRFRRDRERIETQGGTVAQVNAKLNEVSRKQNREIADLEVIRAARSNSLTNAQNLVNRQIELEFGDKIAQVNALKFIYDENKESLTKEEDRLLQQTIKREERAFEVASNEFARLKDAQYTMLEYAKENGAPNNVLKSILQSETAEGAALAAGQYGVDPVRQANLANTYNQIKVRNAELDLKRNQIALSQLSDAQKAAEEESVEKELQKVEAEAALSNLQLISDIYKINPDGSTEIHPGFSGAVGAGIGKTFRGVANAIPFVSVDTEGATSGTSKADFIGTHEQIKNSLTLENLDLMSGVLSETDIKILSSAATKLDLSLSEDAYIQEIQKIQNVFQRTVDKFGVTPEQAQFYYNFTPEEVGSVQDVLGTTPEPTQFNASSYYGS